MRRVFLMFRSVREEDKPSITIQKLWNRVYFDSYGEIVLGGQCDEVSDSIIFLSPGVDKTLHTATYPEA
ncbi:hypothetical protein BPAE_0003g00080 [Botrytis paeoniae]|uniref:Uncharacterized protein n=1 Tax=Botrytis paeoniae TaxID=278948 RepID=A0A4Z1G1M9_9HELO|nr:hypothetical protein BPAE_0003g00080 [Botrytis paeoniae]